MVALFVFLFIVALLSVDQIVRYRKRREAVVKSINGEPRTFPADFISIPKGIFFHPGHTWARMQSGTDVAVGIDDFAQKAIGPIDDIYLPAVGENVKQGEPVISVHHNNRIFQLVSPVSGTVFAVNTALLETPSMIAENPYLDGWLFMVEPVQLASNLSVLSIAEHAVKWIKKEINRFRDFLADQGIRTYPSGEVMLDGGIPVIGSVDYLDDIGAKKFEEEFLR